MDKTIEYYNQNVDMFAQGTRLVDFTVVQERFRIISGNPRQFYYRDECARDEYGEILKENKL